MQPTDTLSRARGHAFPLGASVTVAELDADPHPVLAQLRESEPGRLIDTSTNDPHSHPWCLTVH